MEEAQAKFDLAAQHADVIGGLSQFSGYTSIDMSKYPLDEELKLDTSKPAENIVQGFLGNYVDSIKSESVPWTPRRLGTKVSYECMSSISPFPSISLCTSISILNLMLSKSSHFIPKT